MGPQLNVLGAVTPTVDCMLCSVQMNRAFAQPTAAATKQTCLAMVLHASCQAQYICLNHAIVPSPVPTSLHECTAPGGAPAAYCKHIKTSFDCCLRSSSMCRRLWHVGCRILLLAGHSPPGLLGRACACLAPRSVQVAGSCIVCAHMAQCLCCAARSLASRWASLSPSASLCSVPRYCK